MKIFIPLTRKGLFPKGRFANYLKIYIFASWIIIYFDN